MGEQTSLTGGVVRVDVADKTTLTGAVIASTTDDLILTTGSLEYSNLKDKDKTFTGGITSNESADSQSAGVNYGFTDSRQTNYATIGEGVITVRPLAGSGTGLEGLNRDVTVSQYGTMNVGLEGGFTVDTATVNLVKDTVEAVQDPLLAGATIVYNGITTAAGMYEDSSRTTVKIINETVETYEKTDNLIDSGHYTTDDKVDSYLSMDKFEEKLENGESLSAAEKLNYYGSKKLVGEPLSATEQVDMVEAYVVRKGEIANELKQEILDSYKDSIAPIINAKLDALRQLDPEAASAIDAKFTGIREVENKQNGYTIINTDQYATNITSSNNNGNIEIENCGISLSKVDGATTLGLISTSTDIIMKNIGEGNVMINKATGQVSIYTATETGGVFQGNQYIEKIATTSEVSKIAAAGTVTSVVIGTVIDGMKYNNNEITGDRYAFNTAVNTSLGALSFTPLAVLTIPATLAWVGYSDEIYDKTCPVQKIYGTEDNAIKVREDTARIVKEENDQATNEYLNTLINKYSK